MSVYNVSCKAGMLLDARRAAMPAGPPHGGARPTAGTIGGGTGQMTTDPLFADWDWEDPDALAAAMETFTVDLARCETLEPLPHPLPVTRQDFAGIGVTGIEFAAFKTRHPAGLGTDLVGLHTSTMATEPGHLYKADGTSYFTQLDISEALPFGDGCVDWVYAEHLIEHVPPPVGIGWLTEVRRILAPGGLLRITTPDL